MAKTAQYSVECSRGNASAVVGVARSRVGVRRSGDRSTTEAVAWDIGMEPDAADSLLAVLCDRRAELAADGVDRLVVGCGPTSPVRDAVASIAMDAAIESSGAREPHRQAAEYPE